MPCNSVSRVSVPSSSSFASPFSTSQTVKSCPLSQRDRQKQKKKRTGKRENVPVPLVPSPSLISYTVNTHPFCAVSYTYFSIRAAHSSGFFQYTNTTSLVPLKRLPDPEAEPLAYSARPSLRMSSITAWISFVLRRRSRRALWKSSVSEAVDRESLKMR